MSYLKTSFKISLGGFFLGAGLLLFSGSGAVAAPGGKDFQVDTKKPIEINADSLNVDNNQQVATFSGNVQAAQGDLRLNAKRLVVHYKSSLKTGEAPSSEPAPEPSAGTPQGAIRTLTADGDVFVTSGQANARGQKAVYEVGGRKLTVTGGVTLSQNGNILKGEVLKIDLAAGTSTLSGGNASTGGRVRTMFTPEGGK